MTAFATSTDIATRLGRELTAAETAQVDAFLDDASALIRAELRQEISAVASDSITIESPTGPWLTLPQRPVTAIESVAVNGSAVTDYSQIGDRLYRVYGWAWPSVDTVPPLAIYGTKSTVSVVYNHGYATIPAEIVATCLRMVLRAVNTPGFVGRQAIDDFQGEVPAGADGVYLDDVDRRAIRRFRRKAFSIHLGSPL